MNNTGTKDRIKTALLSLMKTKDFNKISIKDICDQAGLSRTAYYHHYYEQNEVLHDIFNDLLTEIVDSISADTDLSLDLHRSLLFGIYQIRRLKDPLKIIMTSSCESEFMHLWNERWQIQCESSILNAHENEEYRYWYANFIFFGIYSIYRKWLIENCSISEERICKVLENALQNLIPIEPISE